MAKSKCTRCIVVRHPYHGTKFAPKIARALCAAHRGSFRLVQLGLRRRTPLGSARWDKDDRCERFVTHVPPTPHLCPTSQLLVRGGAVQQLLLRFVQALQLKRRGVTHTASACLRPGLVSLPSTQGLAQQRPIFTDERVHARQVRVCSLPTAHDEAFRQRQNVLVKQLKHWAHRQQAGTHTHKRGAAPPPPGP